MKKAVPYSALPAHDPHHAATGCHSLLPDLRPLALCRCLSTALLNM
ncbi:hypothetical protein AR1Y2_3051 [Anaerostipes rhamnosivorans]|uniref:Uncharacterized protein n=1 Tax=Anaerostipes rhamnosivorans TaxID=1229621 RepID=A0A4P8II17_9FIRM|nr:hypothetical protein AR1Y2_3051 [Anaerostipes rhamnosivorans]